MSARIQQRTWAKGSARNAGPTQAKGTVAVREDAGIDWSAIHLCACGKKKSPCEVCGAWICGAPGHLKHDGIPCGPAEVSR